MSRTEKPREDQPFVTEGTSPARVRGGYATFFLTTAFILCADACPGFFAPRCKADGVAWTPDQLVKFLSVQYENLQSFDAWFELEHGSASYDEYKKYNVRSYVSRKALLAGAGLQAPPKPDTDKSYQPPLEYLIHFVKDRGGRVRIDKFGNTGGKKGSLISFHVFDGSRWFHFGANRGVIDDGKDVPDVYQYLAQKVYINEPGGVQFAARALPDFFLTMFQQGRAVIRPRNVEDKHTVRAVVTLGSGAPNAGAYALFDQYTFEFDENIGMSLRGFQKRRVYLEGNEHKEVFPPFGASAAWTDFRDEGNGVWVPHSYELTTHVSLLFPRDGDSYPPGFDINSPTKVPYRAEEFTIGRTRAKVRSLSLNPDPAPEVFSPDYPTDTIVYNAIDGKAYQVGRNPEESEAVIWAAAQRKRSHWGRALTFTLTVGGVFLAGGLVWFLRRRPRSP